MKGSTASAVKCDGALWAALDDHWPIDSDAWALRLDDPLALGLAGLAARVAERMGDQGSTCPPVVAVRLNRRAWFTSWRGKRREDRLPPSYMDDDGNVVPWFVLDVRAAASYLALTDRLCALIGLELAEGEVGRWWLCPETGWTLETTGQGESVGRQLHELDGITDPLTALRAAVAAMEARNAND